MQEARAFFPQKAKEALLPHQLSKLPRLKAFSAWGIVEKNIHFFTRDCRHLQSTFWKILKSYQNWQLALWFYLKDLYKFCIFCGKKLVHLTVPYKHNNKFNIVELRPCCYCAAIHGGKTLDELPNDVLEKLEKNIKEFNSKIT